MIYQDQYSSQEEALGGATALRKDESPAILWGGDGACDPLIPHTAGFDPSRHADWFAPYWAEQDTCAAASAPLKSVARTNARKRSAVPA